VNRDAFDALYAREWGPLVRQVTALCGDPVEAADCVQEAFVRAWEHRRDLADEFGGWVRTAAVRIAINRRSTSLNAAKAWARQALRLDRGRKADLTDQIPVGWQGPVWAALQTVGRDHRDTLVMHYVLDMSVTQIAAAAGVAEGTVKARLSRGRDALLAAVSAAETAGGSAREPAGRPTTIDDGRRHS